MSGYSGGGGSRRYQGGLAISGAHYFADDAGRDAYFSSRPEELKAGLFVSAGEDFYLWDGSGWQSKTAVVQGPKGESGSGRISIAFSYLDFPAGSKAIGIVPAGAAVTLVSVAVSQAFNAGSITIGTPEAQGVLLVSAEAPVAYRETYIKAPIVTVNAHAGQEVRLFLSGAPSEGEGLIDIIYNL